MINSMVSAGLTGNKGSGGFYRRADDGGKLVRSLESGEYVAADASLPARADDSPQDIDDAMKLGFNWIRGPFEMMDALGGQRLRRMISDLGMPVPDALNSDLPFYSVDSQAKELLVRRANNAIETVSLPDGVVRFHLKRQTLEPLASNKAATLYAIENWQGIDAFLARFQEAVAALKYAPVPVIGAPSGLSLGGGFEVLLHCDKLVMHGNTVAGLVESGVGLLPSGGGVKETYLRWYTVTGDWNKAAWKAWMNLGYGAMASSPQTAERLQYFKPDHDQWVMNRDRLYSRSLEMLADTGDGYTPPAVPEFTLASGDILERMAAFMDDGISRGDFFAHDKTVAMAIASVICSESATPDVVSEAQMYQREREAFVSLAKTPQTRARIHSLLNGGGAIRN